MFGYGKLTLIAAALALAACAQTGGATASKYDKAGFTTEVQDNRLWVFRTGSKEYAEFKKHGELTKMVTRIGAGPNGMTVRAGDAATIDAYLAAK
jgi:hypothetical protein